MINPRLAALAEYPFDRLWALLDGVTPPPDLEPMVLSVGEPRHRPLALVAEVLARHADGWGRYPPVEGTEGFRHAAANWLRRRYGLGETAIDPDRHIVPVSGTREALFMAAALAVPERKDGRRRIFTATESLMGLPAESARVLRCRRTCSSVTQHRTCVKARRQHPPSSGEARITAVGRLKTLVRRLAYHQT